MSEAPRTFPDLGKQNVDFFNSLVPIAANADGLLKMLSVGCNKNWRLFYMKGWRVPIDLTAKECEEAWRELPQQLKSSAECDFEFNQKLVDKIVLAVAHAANIFNNWCIQVPDDVQKIILEARTLYDAKLRQRHSLSSGFKL